MVIFDPVVIAALTNFLKLAGPLFGILQGISYLSYIAIALAIVGVNLASFGVALLAILPK
jgi:hypothetical protein